MDESPHWNPLQSDVDLTEEAPVASVTWMAVGDLGNGIEEYIFDAQAAALVESAWYAAVHSADEDAQGMVLPSRHSTYAIDFRAMTQTNLETRTVRQLHRFGPDQDVVPHSPLVPFNEDRGFDQEPHLPMPPQRDTSRQALAPPVDDGTDAAIAAALAELDENVPITATYTTAMGTRHPWHPQHELARTGRAHQWRCDGLSQPGGCRGSGGGFGPRYRCQSGFNYDLCEACWDSSDGLNDGYGSTGSGTGSGSESEDNGHWAYYGGEDRSDIIDPNINSDDGAAFASSHSLDSNQFETSSAVQNSSAGVCTAPECVICLNSISSSEVLALPCIHVFHRSCVLTWLSKSSTCPVCKSAVDFNLS